MFFSKKPKKEIKCIGCNSNVSEKYNFCPYCGQSMIDPIKERDDFGLLGKSDISERDMAARVPPGGADLRIVDRIVSSMVGNLMRNMMQEERTEVSQTPNGIKIKIGAPGKKARRETQKTISEEQIEKMASLPRAQAKTNIKRLSDKIVYELAIPGITSPEDVFVSKLESGYEIKAIGEKKVYVNSLPVNLPIRGFIINEDKLLVEFNTQEGQ